MLFLEERKQIIELGHALIEHELIARTWGNISMRANENQFLITPSGMRYETLKPEDIVLVNINDLSYEGNIKPSSEKGIHASVYELKPEMNCVIHTHQKYASALSAAPFKEIPLKYTVPCAAYGLPGTKHLMGNVRTALYVASQSVVMKFHGALTFGTSGDEALAVARELEEMCQAYIETQLYTTDDPVSDITALFIEQPIKKQYALNEHYLQTPSLLAMSELELDLLPLLDDFAQLTGIKAKCVKDENAVKNDPVTLVKGKGAILKGTPDEIEALRIVTEKAALAYVTAKLFGKVKPIPYFERLLMRLVFKHKYSKQAKGA